MRFPYKASSFQNIQKNFDFLSRFIRNSVSGTIDTSGSGSIIRGTGFKITRNATGDVTVDLDRPLSVVPVIRVSAGETSAYYTVKLYGGSTRTKSSFRVLCFVTNTTASQDGIFDFTVEEP